MLHPDTLIELFDETVLLFHQLKAAAARLHREGELSAARRGVMRSLHEHGPLTVPQLARMRPVSRQHIQTIVDPLAAEGLVRFQPNPAHKRSSLVALTAKGTRLIEAMVRRERQALESAGVSLSETAIRRASRTLKQVRGQIHAQYSKTVR
jgi:DNA-binding MarR family transcriptional regulator